MSYLIDTDILIYSKKGNPIVNEWLQKNKNIPMSVSVITLGELIYGAHKSQHPQRSMITVNHIRNIFPIIELDQGIIEVFGNIKAKQEKKGERLADMDLLIAATALYMNMTLVTNNIKHFSKIDGLSLENWAKN